MTDPENSVHVRPISLPQDALRFVGAWWSINASDPHWVAPLIFERKQFLDPARNPFFQHADVQCFMAFRGDQCVGTISAQIDHEFQKQEPGVGFFGFFEFIDDPAVASALGQAACNWLEQRGMRSARGPFNFNANHEFGALVEGFDTDPCIANPTNQPYYDRRYKEAGFRPAKDWYAYWFDQQGPPEYMLSVGERFMERNPEVRLTMADKKRWQEMMDWTYEIYNDAWSEQWSHSHMTRADLDHLAAGVRALIDERLIWFAFVDGEPAGLALSVPDWNQVVKKMNGRLLPLGWWHLLTGRRKITAMRIWILGIKHKFQHLPLGVPLYLRTWEEARKLGYQGAEASLIIEDNYRMRGALEKLGGRIYKTYRQYEIGLHA